MESTKDIPITEEYFGDYAEVYDNPDIIKQLDTINEEHVIFSCICSKKNKFKFGSSKRTFLLTNLKVYNINKSKI